jgi:starch synthase
MSQKYPDKVGFKMGFIPALARKIYAGADIFLMPSKSEPCGLAQMIACSYGTPPIVRSVGGLKDTIIPYGEEGANGFRFDNFNAHEMLSTILHATNIFKDKDAFRALMKSAKKSVFSWDKSAEKYISIYNKLI